jgi:hypothetical protein
MNRAPVQVEDTLYDRQSKPAPGRLGPGCAIEAAADVGVLIGLNAGACISDPNARIRSGDPDLGWQRGSGGAARVATRAIRGRTDRRRSPCAVAVRATAGTPSRGPGEGR